MRLTGCSRRSSPYRRSLPPSVKFCLRYARCGAGVSLSETLIEEIPERICGSADLLGRGIRVIFSSSPTILSVFAGSLALLASPSEDEYFSEPGHFDLWMDQIYHFSFPTLVIRSLMISPCHVGHGRPSRYQLVIKSGTPEDLLSIEHATLALRFLRRPFLPPPTHAVAVTLIAMSLRLHSPEFSLRPTSVPGIFSPAASRILACSRL